jgi:serine/threonine-protein kinase
MGRVISGKYEELEKLGEGGQGVVYKVRRQTEDKTTLALKAVPTYLLGNSAAIGRFEQEALVLRRLKHRNIVQVLGSGRDEELDLVYIVMEYIQGKTLKAYVQERGPLQLPEVLDIARQVATALAYAHTQSPPVIHRDIKPTNIMIEDASGRVLLLDFGIAKELDEAGESHTRTGSMIGTWKYSSPEQLRHETLTGSSDVYSLGMVMYEMYTAKQFFAGLDEPQVLSRVLNDERDHEPYFARPTIPEFVALVKKAIAKSRDKRYRRMADLLNDLEACWWALEPTRTVDLRDIIAKLSLSSAEPGSASETPAQEPKAAEAVMAEQIVSRRGSQNLETIDAEIQRLQKEKQRLSVVSLETNVRGAREEAERAGAKQWAEALFGTQKFGITLQ